MVDIINCIVLSLISDLILMFCLKKIFGLRVKYVELCCLEIVALAPVVIFVLCKILVIQFLFFKLLAGLLICVLITDSFRFGFLFKLIMAYVVLFFSVYGISCFMVLFAKSVLSQAFGVNVSYAFDFVVLAGVIVYVLLIYMLVHKLSKFKTLKNYLAGVSFMFMGKHIEIVGLLDTGNSLVDDVTHKPVVIVSINAIKRYFSDLSIDSIKNGFVCDRVINCVSAGEKSFKIPVYDVGEICIKRDGEIKSQKCVLGFANREFCDDKDYQCLLHRDFI